MRPLGKVVNAIIDLTQITMYFVSAVSGFLSEGNKIIWKFKDYNVKPDAEVIKMIKNEQITFN